MLRQFLGYVQRRRRYYSEHNFLPSASAELKPLIADGIVVWPNYFSTEQVDAILEKIEAKFPETVPQVKGVDNPDFQWRIFQMDQELIESNDFFDDPKINQLVHDYLGPSTRCSRKALALKNIYNRLKDGPTEFYHFDDWQHRFKVMIYLDDVDDNNGPFCYLRGSHRANLWKYWQDFLFFRGFDRTQPKEGGNVNWVATWLDHQLTCLIKRYGWRENKVVGKRGTVALFDSRGLHRGQPLLKGYRRVFIQHFRLSDQDGELKVWKNRSAYEYQEN